MLPIGPSFALTFKKTSSPTLQKSAATVLVRPRSGRHRRYRSVTGPDDVLDALRALGVTALGSGRAAESFKANEPSRAPLFEVAAPRGNGRTSTFFSPKRR